ncbi:unnamed protein product [Penicillium manginii]
MSDSPAKTPAKSPAKSIDTPAESPVQSSDIRKHKYLLDSFLFLQGGQTILKWDWVGSILKEEAQKSHAPSVLAQDDQFTG